MLLFKEKQSFGQWWFWLIVVLVNIVIAGSVISYSFFDSSVGGQAVNKNELLVVLAITFLVTSFLLAVRLETEVRDDGVYVRFFPVHIHYRFFSWDSIDKLYVRKYNPIVEYGGWGWRVSLTGYGKAYSVSGDTGLQLELKNGAKLLIGTQRPSEIEQVLGKLFTPER